jgi:hypothetical protein
MCGRRDSNPHAVKRQILSLVRLPITPLPQLGFLELAKIIFYVDYTDYFENDYTD